MCGTPVRCDTSALLCGTITHLCGAQPWCGAPMYTLICMRSAQPSVRTRYADLSVDKWHSYLHTHASVRAASCCIICSLALLSAHALVCMYGYGAALGGLSAISYPTCFNAPSSS